MTALTVYEIPVWNMAGLEDKLAKLSKKSVKLIGKPINFTVIGEIRKLRHGQDGNLVRTFDGKKVFDTYLQVTIEAETPKINGWTFVGTIDHSNDGGNIVRVNPNSGFTGTEKYRFVRPVCEHCNKIRSRRDTFLLREDATGDVKQIGRQCIRDFIGYDVENVVAMAEIVWNCVPSDSDEDEEYRGMVDHRSLLVRTFLANVNACIRAYGWRSKKQASEEEKSSTCSEAFQNMYRKPDRNFKPLELIEDDFAMAEAALEYGKALTGRSDYEYNLSLLSKQNIIETRSAGILASLIPAYLRAEQKKVEVAQSNEKMNLANSQYIGTVGERIRDVEAVFYAVITMFDGTSWLYCFQNVDGNVVTWLTSTAIDDLNNFTARQRNVKVRLTGTVKQHRTFRDIKQTALTRCKIELI